MVKKSLFTTLLLSTMVLTGCLQGKEPVDATKFTNLAKNKDLVIEDIEETITAYNMDAALLAYNEDDTYQIEFYDFEKDNIANNEFNSQVNRIKDSYSTGVTTSTTLGGTSSFTYKIGDEYYAIVKVDDTLVSAYTDEKEADLINDFLRELGYK